MPVARIRTVDPDAVAPLAAELREAGFEFEFARPDERCAHEADLEIRADELPIQQAFDRAYEMNADGTSIFVAPGLLEAPDHPVQESPASGNNHQAGQRGRHKEEVAQPEEKPAYELAEPIPYSQSMDLGFQHTSRRFDSERTEKRSRFSEGLENMKGLVGGMVTRFREKQMERESLRSQESAARAEQAAAVRKQQLEALERQRETERRRREELHAQMERQRIEEEQRQREAEETRQWLAAESRKREEEEARQRQAEEARQREAEEKLQRQREAELEKARAIALQQQTRESDLQQQRESQRQREIEQQRVQEEQRRLQQQLQQKKEKEAAELRERELAQNKERQQQAERERQEREQRELAAKAQQERDAREHERLAAATRVTPPPVLVATTRPAQVSPESEREFRASLSHEGVPSSEASLPSFTNARQRAFRQAGIAAAVLTVCAMAAWAAIANRRPADPLNLSRSGRAEIQQQVPFGSATAAAPKPTQTSLPVPVKAAQHAAAPAKPAVVAHKAATKAPTRSPRKAAAKKRSRHNSQTQASTRRTAKRTTTRAQKPSGIRQYSDLD